VKVVAVFALVALVGGLLALMAAAVGWSRVPIVLVLVAGGISGAFAAFLIERRR
jgi:hypothetical protein